jgi:hypothetical protein
MLNLEKLSQIYEGWKNLVFENPEVEKVAIPRLEICAKCPIRTNGACDSSKGGCGCVVSAKARCLDCKCPKGKW